MIPEAEIGFRRLVKLAPEIRRRFPWVIALKLSGSLGDNQYFETNLDGVQICSDYDVVILVDKIPGEEEVKELIRLLKTPCLNSDIEKKLLANIDVKVFTVNFPTHHKMRIPSVFDSNETVWRHLIGGKPVFGEKIFKKYSVADNKKIRLALVERHKKRKKAFDLYAHAGFLLRIAKILKRNDIVKEIIEIVKKYKDFHTISDWQLEKFRKKIEEIEKKLHFQL